MNWITALGESKLRKVFIFIVYSVAQVMLATAQISPEVYASATGNLMIVTLALLGVNGVEHLAERKANGNKPTA